MKLQNKKNDKTNLKNNKFLKMNKLSPFNRFEFAQGITEIIEDHASTHTIFFSTFTFKISHNKTLNNHSVQSNYFRLFRLKLDNCLLSHRKQFRNRPIILLFPEVSKVLTPDHFHGFILLHNSTVKRFCENCVEKVTQESIEALDGAIRDNVVLNSFLLDQSTIKAPKSFKGQMKYRNDQALLQAFRETPHNDRHAYMQEALDKANSYLTIDSHKLYLIADKADFWLASRYSSKKYVHSESDFILETKFKPKNYRETTRPSPQ